MRHIRNVFNSVWVKLIDVHGIKGIFSNINFDWMHQQLKCQLQNKFWQKYLQMFCTTGILFKCRNNVWQQMSIHSPESYICFSCKGFSLPTQWVAPTSIKRVKLLILRSRMTKNGQINKYVLVGPPQPHPQTCKLHKYTFLLFYDYVKTGSSCF